MSPSVQVQDSLTRAMQAATQKAVENLLAQQDSSGSWYNLRITPYRTSDNKIEGAVLVLLDTTSQK